MSCQSVASFVVHISHLPPFVIHPLPVRLTLTHTHTHTFSVSTSHKCNTFSGPLVWWPENQEKPGEPSLSFNNYRKKINTNKDQTWSSVVLLLFYKQLQKKKHPVVSADVHRKKNNLWSNVWNDCDIVMICCWQENYTLCLTPINDPPHSHSHSQPSLWANPPPPLHCHPFVFVSVAVSETDVTRRWQTLMTRALVVWIHWRHARILGRKRRTCVLSNIIGCFPTERRHDSK